MVGMHEGTQQKIPLFTLAEAPWGCLGGRHSGKGCLSELWRGGRQEKMRPHREAAKGMRWGWRGWSQGPGLPLSARSDQNETAITPRFLTRAEFFLNEGHSREKMVWSSAVKMVRTLIVEPPVASWIQNARVNVKCHVYTVLIDGV